MNTLAQRLDQFSHLRMAERRRLHRKRRMTLIRKCERSALIFGFLLGFPAGALLVIVWAVIAFGG